MCRFSGYDISVVVKEALMIPVRKLQTATHFRKVNVYLEKVSRSSCTKSGIWPLLSIRLMCCHFFKDRIFLRVRHFVILLLPVNTNFVEIIESGRLIRKALQVYVPNVSPADVQIFLTRIPRFCNVLQMNVKTNRNTDVFLPQAKDRLRRI